ncbi:hypothetical protein J2Q11_00590 [Tenacibaculum finnmarkense genomovar finnmarkense]|uniref:hypothetical protein n=1 Tax=Tenacibaculum finnmarkense TaxID=2781243 RepID=UPI001E2DC7FC|nr:hypothetical protein [Tenacibaculum finnmarkense]MCD8411315.1 hypothetical protein [Tenacibaculum finnmarkense genomovar ulcerans]MCD8416714.1 hypothetical protein [Tenacibaculum finnmarkense genomovar finnmarkense]MCG8184696.1 hypothetical protein [Tenacibaculum finnmarkense genomovar finnmarkense]MCG8201688.1 hypothetical protein [Tenacibaculum finnmarkense genomovar finnmarkense]MCG8206550.1 hypothetical protein [Tenacibaculum finnmarkense genomovar finnmarkense]
MKKFAYSFPILTDKIEEWLNFAKEVNTTRKLEFTEMHERIGVTKESWYLQKTTVGYDVVIYTEAKDEHFMKNFKNDNSEFSEWFRCKVANIQDINLNTKVTMPKLILDWTD